MRIEANGIGIAVHDDRKTRTWLRVAIAIAAVTGITAPAACGDADDDRSADAGVSQPARASFVGETSNDDAFVGVVREGDHVMAYVTDGEVLGEWFLGEAGGDRPVMVSKNGARLEATVAGDTVTGTFTPPDGPSLPFTAAVARPPAGLYRSERGGQTVGGWIVLPDGRRRGVVQRVIEGRQDRKVVVSPRVPTHEPVRVARVVPLLESFEF
jgi:hypothetical protein